MKYAYIIFVFSFFACAIEHCMYGSDIDELPSHVTRSVVPVTEWLALAYELQHKSLFRFLPAEIQGRIFAYISFGRDTECIDQWVVGYPLCIQEIVVPYAIVNFAVSGDDMALIAKREAEVDKYVYDLHRINLQTKEDYIQHSHNPVCHNYKEECLPNIAFCYDNIVYVFLSDLCYVSKMRSNSFRSFASVSNVEKFQCHDAYPFICVRTDQSKNMRAGTYVAFEEVKQLWPNVGHCITYTSEHKKNIFFTNNAQWHPKELLLAYVATDQSDRNTLCIWEGKKNNVYEVTTQQCNR